MVTSSNTVLLALAATVVLVTCVVADVSKYNDITDEDIMRVTLKTIKAFRPILEQKLDINLSNAITRYTNSLSLSLRDDEENPGEVIGSYYENYENDYSDAGLKKMALIMKTKNTANLIKEYVSTFPEDDKDAGLFIAMFFGGYPAVVKFLDDYDW